ncbi:MAG: TolC family protein [Candidatus Zixiibacteriota bacterium]
MRIGTSHILLLLIIAWAGGGNAQVTSADSTLLPPVFTEYGVQFGTGSALVGDSIVTFTEALQMVLATHPDISGARAQVASAWGRLQQSRSQPNPQLSIDLEDFGRKGASSPAQTTFGVEQPIELFGKRSGRRAVAEAELTSQKYAAQQTMLDLYRSTSIAFVTALGSQTSVQIFRQRLELAMKFEEAVGVKVTDGAVSKAELLRAQSASRLAEIDLSSAEAIARQDRLALSALWSSSESNFRLEGSLEDLLVNIPDDTQLSLDDNPELKSLQEQIKVREADINLARSMGKPDISVGAGYRRLHDEGSNSYLVWTSIPLPIFNRNRGSVAEATANVDLARAELASTRQRLESRLRQLTISLTVRRNQIAELREKVVPPAKQAMEDIDMAYRMGSQPYINVLDAQRTLFELEGEVIDALVAGAQATVEIEQLLGHRLNPVRR